VPIKPILWMHGTSANYGTVAFKLHYDGISRRVELSRYPGAGLARIFLIRRRMNPVWS